MLGLCVLILVISFKVTQNDSNPVVLLEQYTPLLYNWNWFWTIFNQVLFFLLSWFMFLLTRYSKSDKYYGSKLLGNLWVIGPMLAVEGVANILGTRCLMKSLVNHPLTFSQLNPDLLIMSVLSYGVAMWYTMKLWKMKPPTKDKTT